MSDLRELSVVRWRKYGKDRLYVTAPDERRMGWCDLATGVVTVDDDADRAAVEAAVAGWRAAVPEPAQQASPAPSTNAGVTVITESSVAAQEPVWNDLAERRAGQAAREQAIALKHAAPVRTFVARVLRVHTDERAWRIGADGEEMVAARLARLVKKDARWRALHAVPVGVNGSDIDHVVIGPGGVFTLNAKHHPGAKIWVAGTTFMVNGQKQPYLRNSRHEAARASRLLTAAAGVPVEAVGVVVPVGAADITIKKAPEGAHVVYRRAIGKWLERRPEVLDLEAIDRVFEAARRSTTWLG
ncbi:nuclease-related domain-containing protein [Actinotalea sp. JY-7885]|nr:nuclease-related domain-containing protein [Actinotalea sp. JY-7885]